MNISLKQAWVDSINHRMNPKDGYPEMVKDKVREGLFHLWERKHPPGSADRYFEYAIDVACGDFNNPFVDQFLDWSIVCCERAIADPRFEIESDDQQIGWRNALYLKYHGLTLEVLSLAKAFKHNSVIDEEMLLQSVVEKSQYFLECGHWDYIEQFSYLVCIHYLLIIGRIDLALDLLKTRKKFKQVQRHFDWLLEFIRAIPDKGLITDAEAIRTFQEYFDKIRSPSFKAPIDCKNGSAISYNLPLLRLQFALLKHRYIHGQNLTNSWQKVFNQISE